MIIELKPFLKGLKAHEKTVRTCFEMHKQEDVYAEVWADTFTTKYAMAGVYKGEIKTGYSGSSLDIGETSGYCVNLQEVKLRVQKLIGLRYVYGSVWESAGVHGTGTSWFLAGIKPGVQESGGKYGVTEFAIIDNDVKPKQKKGEEEYIELDTLDSKRVWGSLVEAVEFASNDPLRDAYRTVSLVLDVAEFGGMRVSVCATNSFSLLKKVSSYGNSYYPQLVWEVVIPSCAIHSFKAANKTGAYSIMIKGIEGGECLISFIGDAGMVKVAGNQETPIYATNRHTEYFSEGRESVEVLADAFAEGLEGYCKGIERGMVRYLDFCFSEGLIKVVEDGEIAQEVSLQSSDLLPSVALDCVYCKALCETLKKYTKPVNIYANKNKPLESLNFGLTGDNCELYILIMPVQRGNIYKQS